MPLVSRIKTNSIDSLWICLFLLLLFNVSAIIAVESTKPFVIWLAWALAIVCASLCCWVARGYDKNKLDLTAPGIPRYIAPPPPEPTKKIADFYKHLRFDVTESSKVKYIDLKERNKVRVAHAFRIKKSKPLSIYAFYKSYRSRP